MVFFNGSTDYVWGVLDAIPLTNFVSEGIFWPLASEALTWTTCSPTFAPAAPSTRRVRVPYVLHLSLLLPN